MLRLLLISCIFTAAINAADSPPAPKPTKAGTEQSEVKEVVVYITRTGKKYHRAGCRHAKIKSTLAEAKKLGLGPCSKCDPPE